MRIYTLILRLRISARTKTTDMTLWTDIRTDGHTDRHTDGHCSRDSDIMLYWLLPRKHKKFMLYCVALNTSRSNRKRPFSVQKKSVLQPAIQASHS